MQKFLNFLIAFLVAFTLSACGGSSSSEKGDPKPTDPKPTDPTEKVDPKPKDPKPTKNSIVGRVVDGYISGATVFLDSNLNFTHDKDEIKSQTNTSGLFELKEATPKLKAMGNLIVAKGGVDVDTQRELKETLSVSPSKDDVKKAIYITPLSSVIATTAITLVSEGNFGDFTMRNFQDSILKTFGATKDDLHVNPMEDMRVYKINQSIQKTVEITGSTYKEFVKILSKDSKNLKEALNKSSLENKAEAVKLVEYIESLKEDDLKSQRKEIANKVQKEVDNKKFTLTKKPKKDTKKGATITGRVVDGYISGATVFLDLNLNLTKDENEPFSTTDRYGRFSIEGVKLEDINRQNSLVAIGGIDVDTSRALKETLTFTPTLEDIKSPIFITPISSVITRVGLKLANEGAYNGLTMATFKPKILSILGVSEDEIKQNPINNKNAYKATQKIQKIIELEKLSYESFAANLSANQNSLKDTTTNENSKKLIDYIDGLSDGELDKKRVNIAKKVQEQVDSGTFTLTQEDTSKILDDGQVEEVDDFAPTPIEEGEKVIEGTLFFEYNNKATIFFDTNKNRVLDENEKRVRTDANGKFKIGLSSEEIAKRYSLVAIDGKDANGKSEEHKSILFTTPMFENPNNITPVTTFHTSAAYALTGGIMVERLGHTNFSQAVEKALGVAQEDFGANYSQNDALKKANLAINNIVKGLALSVRNNKTYNENFVDYYKFLASNISLNEVGIDTLLDRFQKKNAITKERIDILKEIATTYKNASANDLSSGTVEQKVEALLVKIQNHTKEEDVNDAQPQVYQGLPADQFSKYQWHLKDQGAVVNTQGISTVGGNDLGVDGLYTQGIFGEGVHVRVVDDGVYAEHEDLKGRLSIEDSFNAQTKAKNPTPSKKGDTHGTQVAGLIAADGSNEVGLRGVAPYATLSAYKLRTVGSGGISISMEELKDAWLGGNDSISIVNNSWGPSVIVRGAEEEAILKAGAETKRGGKGRIYLIAAGNGGLNQGEENSISDDSVTAYTRNSQYAITVGSVRNENIITQYSTQGSNVLVSSYGGGVKYSTAALMATTTVPGSSKSTWEEDTKKQYTFGFNGTSAATPVASGALALVMEKCPNLSYRDVKWLIAHTAKKIDPNYEGKTKAAPNVPPYKTTPKAEASAGYGYILNGAGLSHSNYYGYGLIDPSAMIAKCTASNFKHLPNKKSIKFVQETTSLQGLNSNSQHTLEEIILADKAKVSPSDMINKVEWVGLTVYADVKNLPKISILLTSPSGTISRVLTHSKTALTELGEFKLGYRLSSVAFVDEDPFGEWRVHIHSDDESEDGRITKFELEIVGHERNW